MARLACGMATVNELAAPFDISLPAISRHLKVLESCGLISRDRIAQQRPARLEPLAMKEVDEWIEQYRGYWDASFARLDEYLKSVQPEDHDGERS
jgi:DNA-binding transcriptional ArsR family regulator